MKYKLKVDDAKKRDVGRQIARIPVKIAEKLGVRTGDIVKLTGKRVSYAKVWRSSPPEIKEDEIKVEALTRRNLQVNLDDVIEIETTKPSLATLVTVNPIQSISVTSNLTPYLSKAIMDRIMVVGDIISMNTGLGGSLYFNILKTEPEGPVIFNENTQLSIEFEGPVEEIKEKISDISYEDIGGLSEAIQKVREMIELPLRYPEIFEHLGIQPPKGVLLYGPPGTGKTLLAKAISNETSSSFYIISGPEIISKYYGESEGKLREIFEKAQKSSPSIIFIDEIDSLVPKRDGSSGEAEKRIVAQLLSLLDGVNTRGNVVVIGATNRPNSIDEALRRGGRFDREIEIGIPNSDSRYEILQIHTRGMPLDDTVDLNSLASRTHGFVGADLEMLTKEAALYALKRFLPNITLDKDISKLDLDTINQLNVTMQDFEQGLTEVSPSALREVFVESPNVRWEDIGGLKMVKDQLKEAIEWPLRYQKVFERVNSKAPVGILLYGPPGTGKTMLAKAVARESEANFISIKGPELLSKWIGESEKGIREIFRKARSAAPCIIFFDEIDSIAMARDSNSSDAVQRVVSQLLTEMDGLEEMKGVTILAATNRPDIIDPALMRPGRFDKTIFIGNPDQKSREAILKVHVSSTKLADDINLEEIAEKTEGYSGAELSAIISYAKMELIRGYIKEHSNQIEKQLDELVLNQIHVMEALKEINPSSDKKYELKPVGISEINDIGIA